MSLSKDNSFKIDSTHLLVGEKMIDLEALYSRVLGDKIKDYVLPPPSFEIMQCGIVDFNETEKSMLVKMPVLKSFLNPYGTMQGGMIMGAIDNAVGPLSMLVAPQNLTRTMESKLLKPITMDMGTIYIKAILSESKKRRLTFDVVVKDKEENIYAKARVINYIV